MKINSLYREYLIQTVLLLAILGGLVFFAIVPAFNSIIEYKQKISEENKALETKLAMGLNAKKIKEQLDQAEKSIGVLDDVYIAAGKELELLGDLESIASSTGVAISLKPDFNLQAVDKSAKRLPLDMTVTGKLANIMNFANSLDSAPYYYVINSLGLAADASDRLSLAISGQFYVKSSISDSKK